MSKFFNSEYDYTENCRNVDNMIDIFKKDREEVVDLLKNNPNELVERMWSLRSPICKDDSCLFNMGKIFTKTIEGLVEHRDHYISDSLINYYICPQCKNMKRLIDFSVTREGEPFFIECGEKAGSQMIYTKTDINKLYLIKENMPNSVKRALASPTVNELIKCSSASCPVPKLSKTFSLLRQYENMKYLGSDPYTNNILINWYIENELKQQHIPNITDLFISFVCNGKGYNLYEYSELQNINSFQDVADFLCNCGKISPSAKADEKMPLEKDVIKGIIIQLFALLHCLRKYDFSHGNPSGNILKFTKNNVSYLHDGVHVVSPVTLKITDFSKSGCTVKGENQLRLYSKSVIAEAELQKRELKPFIDTISYLPYGCNNKEKVTIYRLKDPRKCIKSSIVFMYMQHLGLPIYQASFDAYAFMLVLMRERSFYSTVMNDSELFRFFRNMWVSNSDFETIKNKLLETHNINRELTAENVYSLLSNLGLRCDMIDFGWESIKLFN